MTGILFAANVLGQLQASGIQAQVDAAMGMPLPGRNVGDGVWCPASQTWTTTYAQTGRVASTMQWAYPVDANNTPFLLASQLALVTSIGSLA